MMPDFISNFMLSEFEYGLPEPMETHALAVHDPVQGRFICNDLQHVAISLII